MKYLLLILITIPLLGAGCEMPKNYGGSTREDLDDLIEHNNFIQGMHARSVAHHQERLEKDKGWIELIDQVEELQNLEPQRVYSDEVEFEEYKNWFVYYQKMFGLTKYKITFSLEDLSYMKESPNSESEKGMLPCAMITHNSIAKTATVHLHKESVQERAKRCWKGVRSSARHEALHLLFTEVGLDHKLSYTEEQEIVIKLTDIIK